MIGKLLLYVSQLYVQGQGNRQLILSHQQKLWSIL